MARMPWQGVLKKQLKRNQVLSFFANLPPCVIGMEACAVAHHGARKLESFGHRVKLMAPKLVKSYVKTNKNDAADAEAICEARPRQSMRFVPTKNVEQQAVLALHEGADPAQYLKFCGRARARVSLDAAY